MVMHFTDKVWWCRLSLNNDVIGFNRMYTLFKLAQNKLRVEVRCLVNYYSCSLVIMCITVYIQYNTYNHIIYVIENISEYN